MKSWNFTFSALYESIFLCSIKLCPPPTLQKEWTTTPHLTIGGFDNKSISQIIGINYCLLTTINLFLWSLFDYPGGISIQLWNWEGIIKYKMHQKNEIIDSFCFKTPTFTYAYVMSQSGQYWCLKNHPDLSYCSPWSDSDLKN